MIIAGIVGAIVLGVIGIILLVVRRRNRIAAGEPVFHLRKNAEGSRWY